jgi:hypothetical protein
MTDDAGQRLCVDCVEKRTQLVDLTSLIQSSATSNTTVLNYLQVTQRIT